MLKNLIVYEGDPRKSLPERIVVHMDSLFNTKEEVRLEAAHAGNGERVVAFIPMAVDDPAVRALASVVELAYEADDRRDVPEPIFVLQLLRDIFIAGRQSATSK
ncbi:hypothetical protein A3G63_00560 [Candidatus Kaiserbacteria bacterium RIFCSPLOWO2_12_FULL_52_8]|uniref:Uncharacterized protein n=1 Tax=Candidatus Kaiserbacteria bacterium RIFCSPHIGHO2_01_FULL_53_31 TaxID=1798481 RepID=A0A1F6CII6_9BACT|nr:MAG: hypothetical protein A2678_01150 [Candidatus Kaiserbacteria bacterium RIFCSPHIGHO2_01_FULL_53_31]OGG92653.1 MAG: hypothetical protein A3G63_00560 [Candidatus Kaiserbacteria bacterium RIFCSPLOWO2_12_FULL_52_8]